MANYFKLDIENTKINIEDLKQSQELINKVDSDLMNKTGKGNDFLGWIDLPLEYDKEEFEKIKIAGKKIKENSDVVVNIGIGGSYLGLKMAIEFLRKDIVMETEMLYAGHTISASYMSSLVEYLKDKDFSLVVVSKSGTTTEPAIAFRILEELLKEKYDNFQDRIYCVTDKAKGALKTIADNNGYETFVIPDDVGGRFSVLTAVGLLGMASVGIDIDSIMEGAKLAHSELLDTSIENNYAYQYALIRNKMLEKYPIELMVSYEPALIYFNEWWKQLYGESEGKELKGLFPASVSFSTDLHSMGQYIQEGQRIFFETIINVTTSSSDIVIKENKEDYDGLNYLSGKTMSFVNQKAYEGTLEAHVDGSVECLVLNVPDLSEKTLGYLIYFFEKACGISGYILGVNPFDQPGVELYKKNMFKLLGKPGV